MVKQVFRKEKQKKETAASAADEAPSYKSLELRQGKADAEMLMEKQTD